MDAGNCSMGCHPGLDLTGHLLPRRGMRLETEPAPPAARRWGSYGSYGQWAVEIDDKMKIKHISSIINMIMVLLKWLFIISIWLMKSIVLPAKPNCLGQNTTGWWYTYPSEKYESQWERLSHVLWKINHVWNDQPVYIYITLLCFYKNDDLLYLWCL